MRAGVSIFALTVALGVGMLSSRAARAQQNAVTPTVAPAAASASGARTVPKTPVPARKRKRRKPAAATVPPGTNDPGTVGETPAQRAADQKLLQRQVAASQATKQINDQQVQQYDANRQKMLNEPRIQDAPGPAQTPIPGTTPPVTPDPQGIQDAPGPAQTNPPVVSPPPAPAAPPQF